ncbi:unnamed protein product [Cyprideis torosa]|uniref:Uncharacterized protein n=1 Tax=Cyprideis torosa TaxID=163714 RepID=A0A7R8W8K7_9CRUS|nr:unnamed protein product [Cyprideis torosa]CAG0886324.1 unnamed protein product [Cyprideis torosa]
MEAEGHDQQEPQEAHVEKVEEGSQEVKGEPGAERGAGLPDEGDEARLSKEEEERLLELSVAKKRLQIIDGERRALEQEFSETRKAKAEEVARLKTEIKAMRGFLQEAEKIKFEDVLTEASLEKHRRLVNAMRRMKAEDAQEYMEEKLAALKKRKNRYDHQIKQLEDRVRTLTSHVAGSKREKEEEELLLEQSDEAKLVRALENKQHDVDTKIREAEHEHAKFESIIRLLEDEKPGFGPQIAALNEQLQKLQTEIKTVQNAQKTAIASRNAAQSAVMEFEVKCSLSRENREQQLQRIRQQAEERRAKNEASSDAWKQGLMVDADGISGMSLFSTRDSPPLHGGGLRFSGVRGSKDTMADEKTVRQLTEDDKTAEHLAKKLYELQEMFGVRSVGEVVGAAREQSIRFHQLSSLRDDLLIKFDRFRKQHLKLLREKDRLQFIQAELQRRELASSSLKLEGGTEEELSSSEAGELAASRNVSHPALVPIDSVRKEEMQSHCDAMQLALKEIRPIILGLIRFMQQIDPSAAVELLVEGGVEGHLSPGFDVGLLVGRCYDRLKAILDSVPPSTTAHVPSSSDLNDGAPGVTANESDVLSSSESQPEEGRGPVTRPPTSTAVKPPTPLPSPTPRLTPLLPTSSSPSSPAQMKRRGSREEDIEIPTRVSLKRMSRRLVEANRLARGPGPGNAPKQSLGQGSRR